MEPSFIKIAWGAVGSALAAMRLKTITVWQRITSFVGGAAAAYVGTGPLNAQWPVLGVEVIAFVLGLFGMAVIAKVFEVLDELKPAQLLRDIAKKKGWL